MKLGIIRENKIPPDSRVPLTPKQCVSLNQQFPVEVFVEASPNRCFSDEEYIAEGVPIVSDISDCDILLGVKEVPINNLIPNKTYCFFSHTIKEQVHNRKLLKAILAKNIRLIDYEVLKNAKGRRLIAFGYFAGMVGAHNGVMTYGLRTGKFHLPRMKDCHDYAEAKSIYKQTSLPPMKIVLTGTGRVGQGAAHVLKDMGILQVNPKHFLEKEFEEPIFTQLKCQDYAAPIADKPFDKLEFYRNPKRYKSIFIPFTEAADIMINGIYWDNNAPVFFTKEAMQQPNFNIQVIADVTCDIAPVSSIPSTLRASTIAEPIFGYDPNTRQETLPFQTGCIDMMTIDNLPNELPRDASQAFGKQFLDHIAAEFLKEESPILEGAMIANEGALGHKFQYLKDYVAGA